MNAMKLLTWVVMGCVIAGGSPALFAAQVKLDVAPVRSVLKAGEKQTTWIRVGLDGFELTSDAPRPSANVAIVLDSEQATIFVL